MARGVLTPPFQEAAQVDRTRTTPSCTAQLLCHCTPSDLRNLSAGTPYSSPLNSAGSEHDFGEPFIRVAGARFWRAGVAVILWLARRAD